MNGCFQAYPLRNVLNLLLLNYKLLNTLTCGLGCFPLDVSPSRDYVWLEIFVLGIFRVSKNFAQSSIAMFQDYFTLPKYSFPYY